MFSNTVRTTCMKVKSLECVIGYWNGAAGVPSLRTEAHTDPMEGEEARLGR